MTPRMSQVIDRVFARLQGIYGTTFTNKFRTGVGHDGIDAGFENAKMVWADELAGFADNLEAIAYGLRYVDPKFPPSAKEFRDLCRNAPKKEAPMLTYTPTAEDLEKQRKLAERVAKSVKARGPDFESEVWAMQPRSVAQFAMIKVAIDIQLERFGHVMEQLKEQGIVSEDGRLLKRYRGMGTWEDVR